MVISTSDLAAFQKSALDRHNELRALHKTPPLVLSDKLNQSSKAWCEKLAAAKAFNHAEQRGEGENLAKTTGRNPPTGASVTDMWYNEIKMYDFTKDVPSHDTLHFTQVVWFETKELGIHIAENEGSFYVVARYGPAGNMMGKFKQCVLPLITKLSDAQSPAPTPAAPTKPSAVSTPAAPTKPGAASTPAAPTKPSATPAPTPTPVPCKPGAAPACTGPSCGAPVSKENVTKAKFQNGMLEFHNKVREVHSAGPLVLQSNLNDMAQELAEKLLLFRLGKGPEPKYPDTKFGKSIMEVGGNELPDPKTLCSSWYDGYKCYDYKSCTPNKQNGGFTQMVWKSTKNVGFGVFWGQNRSVAVAIYSPAGNYQGQYKENVGEINSVV